MKRGTTRRSVSMAGCVYRRAFNHLASLGDDAPPMAAWVQGLITRELDRVAEPEVPHWVVKHEQLERRERPADVEEAVAAHFTF